MKLKIYRETALPGSPVADAIYIIAPTGKPNHVEMYVTNSAAAIRRIINEADITALINTAVSGMTEIVVVADIAARNALSPTTAKYVFVKNATADATVASGGATYLYEVATTTWHKISEAESLDISVSWSSLSGKPTSTPAQIDAAVTASHSHTNKSQLDKIGESGGEITYDGQPVNLHWASTNW